MKTDVGEQAEIDLVLSLLPKEPSIETINEAKKLCNNEWLIFKCGYDHDLRGKPCGKIARCHCTACGGDFSLDIVGGEGKDFGVLDEYGQTVTGGGCMTCPMCGEGVKVMHTSQIRGNVEMSRGFFVSFERVKMKNNLAMLSFIIIKYCDRYGNISYQVKRYEGIVLVRNKFRRVVGYERNMYNSTQWVYLDFWKLKKTFSQDNIMWHGHEVLRLNTDELVGSDLEKSGIDDYIEYLKDSGDELNLEYYLRAWHKYPSIENLVRSGYADYVSAIIERCVDRSARYGSYYYKDVYKLRTSEIPQYINVKKVKPFEIIGVLKEDLSLMKKYRFDEFLFYAKIYLSQGVRLTEEEIKKAFSFTYDFTEIFRKKYGKFVPPVRRTLNYCSWHKERAFGRYLSDYWAMCAEVYDGDIPENIRFPKEIVAMHDRMVLLQRYKTDEKIDGKIKAFAKKNTYLNFEDEELGLKIEVCPGQEALIREGKILEHCVATYAESVAKGSTCILFIRKKASPEIPFYTLEYSGGEVIQNRGKKNCKETDEVVKFKNKWLKYIKKVKREQKNERITANG